MFGNKTKEKKMKRIIVQGLLAVGLVSGMIAFSEESKVPEVNKVGRYMPCENCSGGGFGHSGHTYYLCLFILYLQYVLM